MSRPDFRAAASQRLSEERERDLSPAIVSLLSAETSTRHVGVRQIPLDRIDSNPDNPRLAFDQETLDELAASIREHGVLQPVLVRPLPLGRYQLIAGERRWRASMIARLDTIPAIIEEIDDETALEIAIIENLQREDLSPIDEAIMYDRMIHERGYSIRKLAQKLGKDKGYLENRLRLADAPEEIRELVSVRKDTLSHAYELLKVSDPKKRRKLAGQVARGELSLVKLRERIEGRKPHGIEDEGDPIADGAADAGGEPEVEEQLAPVHKAEPIREDSLIVAKSNLADALEQLVDVLKSPELRDTIGETDRANLAKYLTIAKLRLENAILLVRR